MEISCDVLTTIPYVSLKDVHRTSCTSTFRTGIDKSEEAPLFQLLHAYAAHDPGIGYCQVSSNKKKNTWRLSLFFIALDFLLFSHNVWFIRVWTTWQLCACLTRHRFEWPSNFSAPSWRLDYGAFTTLKFEMKLFWFVYINLTGAIITPLVYLTRSH